MTKKCSKCSGVKDVSEFYWFGKYQANKCKDCLCKMKKVYNKNPANKKRDNERGRKYYKKNKNRLLKIANENHYKYKDSQAKHKRENVETLKDSYMKSVIQCELKRKLNFTIKLSEIPDEMIEAKRDVLKVYRLKRRYNERFRFNAKRI